MDHRLATLVTGVAPLSVGSGWVKYHLQKHGAGALIAVDRDPDPTLVELGNVAVVKCNLNPLVHEAGYAAFVNTLSVTVANNPLSVNGISTVVLCAGAFESGFLVDTPLDARARLMGVNICGHVEMLHTIMSLNQNRGVDNASELSYVQVGSLHGLGASPRRGIYAATKAFGLDLCLSLSSGGELKRAIYLAPGPIDTPMLHRNHWVSKEGGSISFFDHVWAKGMPTYLDIFVRCKDEAFAEEISAGDWNRQQLAETFERYKERRANSNSHPNGVLSVTEIAELLSDIVLKQGTYTDGVYVLTRPCGEIKMEKIPFHEMVRRR